MMRSASIAAIAIASLLLFGCYIIKAQTPTVTPTGTLQGVITGPNGPVNSAAISVTASDATQHGGLSNADGYYSIADIPEGPATFTVRASGYSQVNGSIVITADPGPNRQDVSLNPQ